MHRRGANSEILFAGAPVFCQSARHSGWTQTGGIAISGPPPCHPHTHTHTLELHMQTFRLLMPQSSMPNLFKSSVETPICKSELAACLCIPYLDVTGLCLVMDRDTLGRHQHTLNE